MARQAEIMRGREEGGREGGEGGNGFRESSRKLCGAGRVRVEEI